VIPAVDNNYSAESLALLTQVFKNQANIQTILNAVSAKVQDVENAFWNTINNRLLNPEAAGLTLDNYGSIVGIARNGRSDLDYYNAILLQIRVNRSEGLAEDLIQISNLVTPSTYEETGTASWLVEAYGYGSSVITSPDDLALFLTQAKAAGTYGELHYTLWPFAETFIFGSVQSASVGNLDFGSVRTNTVGELLAATAPCGAA
jgi:hypothetical protein